MSDPDLMASGLAAQVIESMTERGLTLATAESLTGGMIGATLTGVPGSSAVFRGGVISYATQVKTTVLGVDEADVDDFTVISAEVALDMARGAQRVIGSDWAVAVTGVAGPDPQDGHEPGEVHVAVVGPTIGTDIRSEYHEELHLAGDRAAIRLATVEAALRLIMRVLPDAA